MRDATLRSEVCEISEKDFWSSFRILEEKEPDASRKLEAAIGLAEGGHKARAYNRIADYHMMTLAEEWESIRGEFVSKNAPDSEELDDLYERRIKGPAGKSVSFGEDFDWNCREFGPQGCYRFHRLEWLMPAVQKYIRDGERRWARFLNRVLVSYYHARNNEGYLANKQHPVYCERGIDRKLDVLLPAYLALVNNDDAAVDTVEAILKFFLGFGRWLQSAVKNFRPDAAHSVGTASLFRLARLFPEFEKSRDWEDQTIDNLVSHADKSFTNDGCHISRCWQTGWCVLGALTEAYLLAVKRGGFPKEERHFRNRLRIAFRWMARTMGPGDTMPGYGNGWVKESPEVFDLAGKLFRDTGDRYFGEDRGRSWRLRRSGYAVMRNGTGATSGYLLLNFGRFADDRAHFDLLNLDFWAYGQPLIDEAGGSCSRDQGLDCVMRTPRSHNQVLIDGHPYDSRAIEAKDIIWKSTQEIDFFSACHRAYRKRGEVDGRDFIPSMDAVIRRTVVFVKEPGYAVVMDSVQPEGNGHHNRSISAWWHSSQPFKVAATGRAITKGSPGMLLFSVRPQGIHRMETGVDRYPDECMEKNMARYYLRVRRWGAPGHTGCLGFITLLYPFEDKTPEIAFDTLPTHGGEQWRSEAIEVRSPAGRDILVLNPERMRNLLWRGRDLSSRAWIRLGGERGTVTVE
ncbi:MAG: heparinase II/III family protein [Planctomycetes bacterium]|nr:heparinase II/III family protein [Planctomycetota bacterium]